MFGLYLIDFVAETVFKRESSVSCFCSLIKSLLAVVENGLEGGNSGARDTS